MKQPHLPPAGPRPLQACSRNRCQLLDMHKESRRPQQDARQLRGYGLGPPAFKTPCRGMARLQAVMHGIYLAAAYDAVMARSASSAPAWNRLCMMVLRTQTGESPGSVQVCGLESSAANKVTLSAASRRHRDASSKAMWHWPQPSQQLMVQRLLADTASTCMQLVRYLAVYGVRTWPGGCAQRLSWLDTFPVPP